MSWIRLSGQTSEVFNFKPLMMDEFIPTVRFNKAAFSRPKSMCIVESSKKATLSDKIDQDKRDISIFSITAGPGILRLPFIVEEGKGTWDDNGVISARISPPNNEVSIIKNETVTVKISDTFEIALDLQGFKEKQFYLDFYANDNEDELNKGEYKDLHCGRVSITMAGSSKVGFRLLANIDALPPAPPGYTYPNWDTADISEITRSQKQANQYNNCLGVCYATTESRAQQAYIDETGSGVVDLTVSKNNVDHRIAATYGTKDSYMGYGAGGPFVLHGVGKTVDDTGVWAGELKAGALLQLWHSTNPSSLYENGGHSVIFRNYLYDDTGNITGIAYTDYHGGSGASWSRAIYQSNKTILGVNLKD